MLKMEECTKTNVGKYQTGDSKDQTKRYYVDFYDMFDGWGGFGFFADRLSDDLDEAIKLCDKLNSELDDNNKSCGHHYGVIYSNINR